MITAEAALAICRWFFYVTVSSLCGSSIFVAFLVPPTLGRQVSACAEVGIRVSSLVAVAASLAWLPVQAAVINGDWAFAFDGAGLSTLAFRTTTGNACMIRVALALSVAVVSLARPHAVRWLTFYSTLLLLSLVLSGHSMMNEGPWRAIQVVNHGIHLLSGSFWFGSLALLPLCLARLRDSASHTEAMIALRRFSTAGHLAVALVIATGAANTALILGKLPVNQTSPYQLLLAAKIILVCAMSAIALINRYVFVPQFRARPEQAVSRIRAGTLAELVLGACAMALVAVFGLMEPH